MSNPYSCSHASVRGVTATPADSAMRGKGQWDPLPLGIEMLALGSKMSLWGGTPMWCFLQGEGTIWSYATVGYLDCAQNLSNRCCPYN